MSRCVLEHVYGSDKHVELFIYCDIMFFFVCIVNISSRMMFECSVTNMINNE